MMELDGKFFKELRDKNTEAILNHVATRAEIKGMAINQNKTGLMIVSAATSFEPRVRVTVKGAEIQGSDTLKVLGVTLDSNCTFRTHTQNLVKNMRKKCGRYQN